jgi:hydroxyacylglutathione hydrolase
MTLALQPIPILTDNYAWLATDRPSGATAIVDPAEEAPIARAIDAAGGRLDLILLTHHHADHIAAADAIRRRYGGRIVGSRADAARLPKLDLPVADGDTIRLGDSSGTVLETPGHTIHHISFFFPGTPALFCGDTLFSLGCGRLLEGTAAQMFASLARLAALPDATLVCCGHEYTRNNARFALAADPDNKALRARAQWIETVRAQGQPTLPALLGNEKQENPFLRAETRSAFATLRAAKDRA